MKLNLGCGDKKMKGYINVDITHGCDFLWDLRSMPWPWPRESASEIYMSHSLEHLPDTYATLAEIKRVLRSGGVFWGQVPHATSYSGLMHPQHYRHFTDQSFGILSQHFGMPLVYARNSNCKPANWKFRLRNLLPFKNLLQGFFLNIYDNVDFKLMKP